MRQAMPAVQYVQSAERGLAGGMGVAVESCNATVPGDDMYHTLSSEVLTLPPMDPYGSPARWVDIFSRGTSQFSWNISAPSYLTSTQINGSLSPNATADVRVWVSVDWSQLAPGSTSMATINISSSTNYGTQYSMPQVMLPLNYTVVPLSFTNGFVESDGHISIEAEHWSSISASTANVTYEVIPYLSRTLSGITLFPVTAESLSSSTGPALVYDLYTFSNLSSGMALDPNQGIVNVYTPNTINITLILGTSLNAIPARPLRYAVQFDDQPVQVVQYIVDQPAGANPTGWLNAVGNAAWTDTTTWNYTTPGSHELKVWELEPAMVLTKIVIDLGGVRQSYLGPPESWRM